MIHDLDDSTHQTVLKRGRPYLLIGVSTPWLPNQPKSKEGWDEPRPDGWFGGDGSVPEPILSTVLSTCRQRTCMAEHPVNPDPMQEAPHLVDTDKRKHPTFSVKTELVRPSKFIAD